MTRQNETAFTRVLRSTGVACFVVGWCVGGSLIGAFNGLAFSQSAQTGTALKAGENLKETERALSEARRERERLAAEREAAALELAQLRQTLILSAQDAQEREALVTSLEGQIQKLRAERDQRRLALENNRRELSLVTGALVRVARASPSAILLQPGPPQNAARSAILFRATAPALAERAAILRDELTALNAVEADIARNIQTLSGAETALVGERQALNDLIAEKRALLSQSEEAMTEASRRIQELVAEAKSLQDLVEKLATSQIGDAQIGGTESGGAAGLNASSVPAANPNQGDGTGVEPGASAPLVASRQLGAPPAERPLGLRAFPEDGPINRPVSGSVIQGFGANTGFGQDSRGVVIGARLGAFVTAPFDGRIAFAGPFQTLGDIIIIEHDGGYHTVLAGFSRIDVQSGQWILAGEPVGIVGRFDSDNSRPSLYVELRRDGTPVNPLRWRG